MNVNQQILLSPLKARVGGIAVKHTSLSIKSKSWWNCS